MQNTQFYIKELEEAAKTLRNVSATVEGALAMLKAPNTKKTIRKKRSNRANELKAQILSKK